MKKFIIERDIPSIGTMDQIALQAAAAQSCDALNRIGPKIQWLESFVAGNKTFCVYLAEDKALIRQHAEFSGFPANQVTEILNTISPLTAG
ncbi:DUF4242 domain-containing protein [Marinicella sp. S1101]|uniref:DUF4242 domain-containing protein n=1 Tax=Marinicella marina TaxID=2996016 RepID=UPI0022609B1C|nr:DUF4242 domain-containing protein [Marinicella marina]MCX7554823.1 DUF4242 domain-containing protein [Marinicella marina]MDJ1140944.1 DUF4242 domain-containing protein [Marinicella marina]